MLAEKTTGRFTEKTVSFSLGQKTTQIFAADTVLGRIRESCIRHLIFTIAKLPGTATPKITATLNETSPQHLARLILTVLILTDDTSDPMLNAELAVHLWYSAKLSKTLLRHMERVAGNTLLTVMDDVKRLYDNGQLTEEKNFPISMPRGQSSVIIDINRDQWSQVVGFLKVTQVVKSDDCGLIRGLDCRRFAQPFPQLLQRMSRARATGLMRWRFDGLLLPFAHPREGFNILNPVFFSDSMKYPMGATQEPLTEWSMGLLDYDCGPAQNDVYGKMFYYVRDLCVAFQKRIKILPLEIRTISKLIHELPAYHTIGSTKKQFDRIEAAHYWDRRPFLSSVVLSDLLRHEDENPNATLLTLSVKSVVHQMGSVKKDLNTEREALFERTGTALDQYAPPLREGQLDDTKGAIRRKLGLILWRNWDKFSEHYLGASHYFHLLNIATGFNQPERGLAATGFLGLALKARNSITRRWPNRLVHNRTDIPTLRDFNRWLGWGNNMPQRWFEWKKFSDVKSEEWQKHFDLALSEEKATSSGTLRELNLDQAIMEMFSVPQGLNGQEASPEAAVNVENTQDQVNSKPPQDANTGNLGNENGKAVNGIENGNTEDKEKTTDKAKTKKKKNKKNNKGGK
ncbi:hypothetical protein QQX98_009751 [Neonectria punicea]|uniref:DUF4470 domain-containing protein n=1 Tax=Neonectria punicea TaxID=979145 RepID=A0ABR1GRP2_9HYPO